MASIVKQSFFHIWRTFTADKERLLPYARNDRAIHSLTY
jgi:hypothetical protein